MLADPVWSDLSSGSSGKFKNECWPEFLGVLEDTLMFEARSSLESVFYLKVCVDSGDFLEFKTIFSSSISLFNSSIFKSSPRLFSVGKLMLIEPDFLANRSDREVASF